MSSLKNFIFFFVIGVSFSLANVQNLKVPGEIIRPPTPGGGGGGGGGGTGVPTVPSTGTGNTCPAPSEAALRCIRQWACQYIIRLDLRCLLNLNGNPLLGNLLGGNVGSTGGTGGGGGGGLLGGILGI